MLSSLRKILKFGENTISFTVYSDLQGAQTVSSRVFLWEHSAKLVISDIDGTITKSDILGNLMPLMGKDWSHVGVTDLYTNIMNNGYKVLYLTSRAIGQANITRGYIHSLRQGVKGLPPGPVIMSPDRLIHSFKREVIDRKPQEFKIVALRDVRHLFADDYNPFYAGFGNRPTDVIAYRAVGVPSSRIFIINPNGEISTCNTSFVHSYPTINAAVNQMFPSSDSDGTNAQVEYNDHNFWSDPVDDDEELEDL
jgi:phosphatidate phosphatase LPIN